jgi:hypothetical protein
MFSSTNSQSQAGLIQRRDSINRHGTPGTISNIETGRHQQVKRSVYARLRRALRINGEGAAEQSEETYREIVEGVFYLDEAAGQAVAQLINNLKRKP